jgi:hypothetical protein
MRKPVRNPQIECWLAVPLAFAPVPKERIERASKAAVQTLMRD